jgi:hypothetical protein
LFACGRRQWLPLFVHQVVISLANSNNFFGSWYELYMDRWEKTVTAPIRVGMFLEIPLMIIALIFGAWGIIRRKGSMI